MHHRYTYLMLVGAVALIGVSCAQTIQIRTDSRRLSVLATYHTFSIRQGNSSGLPDLDELIECDVATALSAKGWEEAYEREGDAVVVENTTTRLKHSYEAFYRDSGWRWRNGLPGDEDLLVGTIAIDIFDARTKEAVWHGLVKHVIVADKLPTTELWALDEADAMKMWMRAGDAIAKMFEHFPSV